ncbi:uncharacterized protein LOC134288798 [Aedes albopictus]|uniref:Uncharacterized protein n=1 Tax=Aedes albopictus TaxID=7160 RepID=A0ABM2A3D2_AEDAL
MVVHPKSLQFVIDTWPDGAKERFTASPCKQQRAQIRIIRTPLSKPTGPTDHVRNFWHQDGDKTINNKHTVKTIVFGDVRDISGELGGHRSRHRRSCIRTSWRLSLKSLGTLKETEPQPTPRGSQHARGGSAQATLEFCVWGNRRKPICGHAVAEPPAGIDFRWTTQVAQKLRAPEGA